MKKFQSFANPDKHQAAFEVSYVPATRTLTVPAGKLTRNGVRYQLKDDEEVVLPGIDRKTAFAIYIVDMGGVIRVLSDTISDVDPPIDFSNSPIKVLHRVALVEFADASSEADVSVFYVDPIGFAKRS